ncbi:hypothetical protein [Microbacterium sp.]|uniref:hypothetical protein n=1 Tax=Microbacterium sp. TaxID=51671 RepID=UPI003F9E0870
MSDDTDAQPTDGLWSRLRLIEGQPLAARAEAYTAVHDDLFRRLESGAKLDSREKTPSGDR